MYDFRQKEGENFLDWKHRLLISKLDKEHDLDWIEIRDILKLECSPDHLRKLAYGIYEYHSNVKDKKQEYDMPEELEEKMTQFRQMKYQYQDQRREFTKVERWEARLKHLHEEVIKAVKELNLVKPLDWHEPDYSFLNHEVESALLLSDWHYGLFAKNYWNNFDNREFKRRIKRLVEKTIRHSRLHGANTINVFGLGDFVNGLIHVTTRISNTEDVVKQTMFVAEILAEILVELANNFDKVNYFHCRGNHDRVMANKHDEIASESFADIIFWHLETRLKSDEDKFTNIELFNNAIDDEIIVTEICSKKVFAVHGHKDKVSTVVNDLTGMVGYKPDYVFMGHIHHHEENEYHRTEVVVNPSLSGVDEYAKNVRKTSNPAQKLVIFDDHEGRLCTYNIRLDIA